MSGLQITQRRPPKLTHGAVKFEKMFNLGNLHLNIFAKIFEKSRLQYCLPILPMHKKIPI